VRVIRKKHQSRDAERVTGVVKNVKSEKGKIPQTAKRKDEGYCPAGMSSEFWRIWIAGYRVRQY
jgi:hypothetical protein